jgi:hypothetical protein
MSDTPQGIGKVRSITINIIIIYKYCLSEYQPEIQ